jgi:hypothetical protein
VVAFLLSQLLYHQNVDANTYVYSGAVFARERLRPGLGLLTLLIRLNRNRQISTRGLKGPPALS